MSSRTPPQNGAFNTFQRAMLDWNELHPYNAVHVVRVPGSLDIDRLKSVISQTLSYLGLSSFSLDPRKTCFERYSDPEPAAIQWLAGADSSPNALHAEIERQLNTPFTFTTRSSPFRWFVQPEQDFVALGVAYFHPVADAESVVLLLKIMAEAYGSPQPSQLMKILTVYPTLGGTLLGRHPAPLFRKLLSLPETSASLRHSYRASYRDPSDMKNSCSFFSLSPERFGALLAAAKAWAVTLNDVFLALLLKCFSPLAARRAKSTKRRRIALGCIVNLRKDLGLDTRPVFGLFLGSFVVTHEAPDTIGLMQLAQDLRRQTLKIKQRQLYLGTPIELALGRFMLAFFSTARRKKLYQKHYPLWGGVTNMNLNTVWKGQADPQITDYLRAVSTGPATPFVLSATTVHDHLNVALTCRSTVFSLADIEHIKTIFLNNVNNLETTPCACNP